MNRRGKGWGGAWVVVAVVAAWSTAVPAPAAGQITGVTVTQAGEPIEGVLVEAWGADRRLQVRVTDEAGRFNFPAPVADLTMALYAHRIGFRALRAEVRSGVRDYTLRMAADPITIEGLIVRVEEAICSRREDDAARILWERTAARYSRGIDTLGVATYVAASIGAVGPDELGPVPVGSGGSVQRGSAPLFRASWRRRVARSGYARPLSAPSSDGTFEAWGYPPLEADFAVHFGDPTFGDLHRFTLEDERVDGWIVRFCPRDDDNPTISGILQISTDTLFMAAEWSFDTDEPDEGAGGRAIFATQDEIAGPRYLLPVEGLFWRRAGRTQYLQRYERFEGWVLAPGDSVPFLPLRGAAPTSTLDTTALARPMPPG